MASYPGAVFAKTTHNTGDIIQAADTNTLEDEIVAVEQDLVNGALRVNLTPSADVAKNIGSASFRWQNFYSQALYAVFVSSAVNYLQIQGAATSGTPSIIAEGTDSVVSINLSVKGAAGAIGLATGNVNWIQAQGGGTGSTPTLQVLGSDPNITLGLVEKGAGQVALGQLLANWLGSKSSATGSDPILTVNSGDTVRGLLLKTNGAGGAGGANTGGLSIQPGSTVVATAGVIRLPNNMGGIQWENQAGNGNITGIEVDNGNNLVLGGGTGFGRTKINNGSETLTFLRGRVSAAGAINSGTGFTITKGASGIFTINFTTAFATAPAVVVTPEIGSATDVQILVNPPTTGACSINTMTGAGILTDEAFNFIAFG